MILKEIQILFDAGALAACEILRAPMQDEWYLVFIRKSDKAMLSLTTQRSGEDVRCFKTLDAAYKAAAGIGFKVVAVRG